MHVCCSYDVAVPVKDEWSVPLSAAAAWSLMALWSFRREHYYFPQWHSICTDPFVMCSTVSMYAFFPHWDSVVSTCCSSRRLGLSSYTHMTGQNYNSSSRSSSALLWPPRAPDVYKSILKTARTLRDIYGFWFCFFCYSCYCSAVGWTQSPFIYVNKHSITELYLQPLCLVVLFFFF